MEFRVLGPVEVFDDGRWVQIRRGKEQALLAYLLLHANELVSSDRLIDDLWGEGPPPTVRKNLQNAVSQLRKALGEGRVVTEPPGYRFRVDPGELDLHRFEELAEEGRRAMDAELLRNALAIWRGEALANVRDAPFAQHAAAALEEARVAALEDRIDADLAAGRHSELVPELERLIASHPLRERLYGQLMLALYRSGRQADALDAYRRARKTLNEELGLEPSPQVQALERRVLNQDPELAVMASVSPALLRPLRRRRLSIALAAAGFLAIVAAVVVVAFATGGNESPIVVPNSLVKIDPRTNKVVDVVHIGRQPVSVAAAGDFVWIVNYRDETVSRFDTRSGAVEAKGGLKRPVNIAAQGDSAVWVTTATQQKVIRIDAKTLDVDRVVDVGHTAFLNAVGAGSLWVTEPSDDFGSPGTLARIDLATARLLRRYRVGVIPAGVGVVGGAAWVGNIADASLTRVNLNDDHVERVPIGSSPVNLTTAFGSVWVIVGQNKVWRVNPATRLADEVINVGKGPFSIAAGADAVWVGFPMTGTVKRIDPQTNRVVKTIKLRSFVHGIAARDDGVWIAVSDEPAELPF